MALWKAKSLTPEQKVQAVEEESEQKLQSEESGSFLGIDDVCFSEVYSLNLSVPVSYSLSLQCATWNSITFGKNVFDLV